MASLQSKADAVKTAVSSISTCTSATTVTVKELLLSGADSDASSSTFVPATGKSTKAAPPKVKATGGTRTTGKAKKEELSPKEKGSLATQIINAALKSLSEASKPAPPTPAASCRRQNSGGELRRSAARGTIRRSNSAPMTPLQPRSLNRVSTSPIITAKAAKAAPVTAQTNGCLATVECLRAAFSCLRTLQASGKLSLPEFQLESGMSSMIGKLIGLGMQDHALKELAILKRRLEVVGTSKNSGKPTAPISAEAIAKPKSLADLLDFKGVVASGPKLSLVITTQLQILRLISATKKPAIIEASLPFLDHNYSSSPLNLLLESAKSSSQELAKASRQIDLLSQLILSLPPSVSSKDDTVAMESRLSPSMTCSLQLLTLGLEARLHWWRLAGHNGEVDKDILSPFSRCLTAFVRRSKSNPAEVYHTCIDAFNRINGMIESQKLQPAKSSKTPLATIYQVLGTAAQDGRLFKEATEWIDRLKRCLDAKQDSPARCCAVTAQLLAVAVKQHQPAPVTVEHLLKEVLEGLQGSLRGDTTELEELMVNLSMARRAAVGVLAGKSETTRSQSSSNDTARSLFSTFILQYPRFSLRWLGKPPSSDSSTKDFIRYEQKRQLLMSSVQQILDSALVVTKTLADEETLDWEQLDRVLQDCLALLELIGDFKPSAASASDSSSPYHVKISNLYYMYFTHICRTSKDSKDKTSLRALRRSIDSVKDRSAKEKERAQFVMKLERFSELCKFSGRIEDARDALKSICTAMVEEGVLSTVAASLADQPPVVAWSLSTKAEVLSRTLSAMTKLDKSWNDWTFFLAETERGAVLEHLLQITLPEKVRGASPINLTDPVVEILLRIYSPERFPLRRLRILLQLLAVNLDSLERFQSIRLQADAALKAIQTNALGDDSDLRRYIPHSTAFLASMASLVGSDSGWPSKEVTDALHSWRLIVDSCQSKAEVYANIDNPQGLLSHLGSVREFASLRGENKLLLSVLELSADISLKLSEPTTDDLVLSHSLLANQYVYLGYTAKAADALERALQSTPSTNGPSGLALAKFYLSSAEHQLGVQRCDMAEQFVVQAKAAFEKELSSRRSSKLQRKLLVAQASHLCSIIALEKGDTHHALSHAKESVRLLFQDWAKLETRRHSHDDDVQTHDISNVSKLEESLSEVTSQTKLIGASDGPEFWALAYPLLRSTSRLSTMYAHLGMFQETLYYAEKAQAIASSTGSSLYQAQVASWIGSVWIKGNKPEKGLIFLNQAKLLISNSQSPGYAIDLVCQLSASYGKIKDINSEWQLLEMAEATLQLMDTGANNTAQGSGALEPNDLTEKMCNLTLKGTKSRSTRTVKAKPTAGARALKKPLAAKSKAPAPVKSVLTADDPRVASLNASILVHKALALVGKKDWLAASELLEKLKQLSTTMRDSVTVQVAAAICLVGQSKDQMTRDPVFSVVQDSTISFPSVSGVLASDKGVTERLSLGGPSPPRKGRSKALATERNGSKERPSSEFVDMLRQAQGHLMEAHSMAVVTGDGSLVHRISTLLQSTLIILSAASTATPRNLGHVGYATCSVELARNITWRRERKTVLAEKASSKQTEGNWPVVAATLDPRRSSLAFTTDMIRFQRDYVDIIPKAWTVLSISLSDNHHDLCITKLQSSHTPFVLRLPLERANSRDADTEIFNFQHGHEELLEIIQAANNSCHDARDMTAKGAKADWWSEREALDTRFKELLESIEQIWLGGFKGVFSQHQRRTDLLARFQKSFQQILDKHLPSRRQVRGRKSTKTPKITLDPRILDLFIGLGDPTVPDCDLDEALNDLLYFVVDVLQFHGERNAYDEIDFDSMVVDTSDALHAYYMAAKSNPEPMNGAHTILVLDKALHAFPWESLPCMHGLPVSRVPSLSYLRRLILEQRSTIAESFDNETPGHRHDHRDHTVSPANGTYILNPSSDLTNTLAAFEKPLKGLGTSWTGIVSREPTETEFEGALTNSDILLYFGHGSGAQYIRGKSIRRLEKCRSTVLLMGCSSASLADVGDFECHGPVWNYMLAGCPAVVGTLWDVTDKDIDRFAGRLFEEWGLVEKGAFVEKEKSSNKARGASPADRKGKKKMQMQESSDEESEAAAERGNASLAEAVAKARDACRFKYLTAAAVCVYGIPVYISKEDA